MDRSSIDSDPHYSPCFFAFGWKKLVRADIPLLFTFSRHLFATDRASSMFLDFGVSFADPVVSVSLLLTDAQVVAEAELSRTDFFSVTGNTSCSDIS